MSENFKTIDEREGSWSTNSVQGYLHHRNMIIGNMKESLYYFDLHHDFRAFEFLEKAFAEMKLTKKWEAYSNESSELLRLCAERIKGMEQGIGYTDVGRPLHELALEAAFGKSTRDQ